MSSLAYFVSLIHALKVGYELLGEQFGSDDCELNRETVEEFMDRHGTLVILITRYSKKNKYLISLAVTFIVAAVAVLGGLGIYMATKNFGFLIWPALIVIPAFLLLGHIAWLSAASNSLKNDVMHSVAKKRARAVAKSRNTEQTGPTNTRVDSSDPCSNQAEEQTQAQLLLYGYLLNSTDVYWSIGVDITPGLVVSIVSVLGTLLAAIIPYIIDIK